MATLNGEPVDLQALFAGIDAINHPRPGFLAQKIVGIQDSVPACTWGGDLGGAVASWGSAKVSTGSVSREQAFSRHSPSSDQRGNIDGIVIATLSRNARDKLSDLLQRYYTSQWRHRTAHFFKAMNWQCADQLNSKDRQYVRNQMERLAKAYFRKSHPSYIFRAMPWTQQDLDW